MRFQEDSEGTDCLEAAKFSFAPSSAFVDRDEIGLQFKGDLNGLALTSVKRLVPRRSTRCDNRLHVEPSRSNCSASRANPDGS